MTVVLAGGVGIGVALIVLGMECAIGLMTRGVMEPLRELAGSSGLPRIAGLVGPPLVLALALLVAAGISRRWAPETAGTGTAQVMSAVGRRGGFIRACVLPIKALTSVLCIGAGAPLGLEAPIVQTGGALGSLAGRRFRMGTSSIRILVAAGAAAALATRYGAPIGGAVFGAELILGSTSAGALLPLIMASFLAVATRNAVLRGAPEYVVAAQPHPALRDLVLCVGLGVVCGIAAVYFIKMLFVAERGVARAVRPWWARALIGGMAIGAFGLIFPDALGTGKAVVARLLAGPGAALGTLALLVLLRPLLCGGALGSGGSGGAFGPALLVGAAVGSLYAGVIARFMPFESSLSAAYAMAGMAAVVAAVMRAPLQAILITFELTRNYSVLPLLMITVVVALKVSEMFEPESVFTRRLVAAGERLKRGMDVSLLSGLTVRDIMDEDYVGLSAGATIWEVAEDVQASENRTFPVVDEGGRFRGLVMLASLITAGAEASEAGEPALLADILEPDAVCLHPDDGLLAAWEMMGNYDYDCLPVCARDPGGMQVLGICEREAILEIHDRLAFVSMCPVEEDDP